MESCLENSNESFEPKVQPQPDGPNKPPRTPGTRVGAGDGEPPPWSDIESIRRRPAVFVGSTKESGLHHLILDLIMRIVSSTDDSCHVEVCVNGNSSVSITVDKTHWLNSETSFELTESSLNSSFTKLPLPWNESESAARRIVSRDLPVPFAVVNALSEYLYIEVVHDGCEYRKKFARGISWDLLSSSASKKTDSFSITLLPDDEIFEISDEDGHTKPVELSRQAFSSHLRQTAFLYRSRRLSLKDLRPLAEVESEVFQYEGGIAQYVEYLNEERTTLHALPIYFSATVDHVFLECALQWTNLYSQSVYSFVNGISTMEGGTHLAGFSSAVRRALTDYGRETKTIGENEMMLYFDDFAEGLTAIINVLMDKPELTGQTLEYLSNSEVQNIAEKIVADRLLAWLKEHPQEAEQIVRKGLDTADYNRKYRR